MTDEQIRVMNFLRCNPGTWFGRKEIARRATKRKIFEENPNWADMAIADLLLKKIIEQDPTGLVRVGKDEELP